MTDSVTNAKVEDVLSSVKRMVSEEVREESEFIFIPTATARKPGRLVLTEALRVGEAEKPAPLKLVPEAGATKVAPEAATNAPGSTAGPMRLNPSDIVQPQQYQSNRDVKTDDNVAESPRDGAVEGGEKRDLAGSLSAKIEALEAAIARTEDQWEPDGESDDDYAGTPTKTVDWPQTSAEQPAEEAPETPVMFTRSADTATPVHAASATLDEDALSELVAQIVRQELQGALGEGITRNIRKMVRREINKALTARETT